MMARVPEIEQVTRWQIEPGDRLVVKVKGRRLSNTEAEIIRRVVHRDLHLVADFPVLVVDSSYEVSVATVLG
jgi:hypothetical protein